MTRISDQLNSMRQVYIRGVVASRAEARHITLDSANASGGPMEDMHASMAMCRLLHKEFNMATNLALDPFLLDRVVAVSGESTKKVAVTLALKEIIARREQRRVSELFGTLEWDASDDYKAERSRS